MSRYPLCAKCSIEMNPNLYDDVTPYYVVGEELYCPECLKEHLKDMIDSDPEFIAEALGIPAVHTGVQL